MLTDITEVLEMCDDIIMEIGELPEQAEEFADSVENTVFDIRNWIEDNNHVTDRQLSALRNIRAGVRKWLDRQDSRIDY